MEKKDTCRIFIEERIFIRSDSQIDNDAYTGK